MPTMRQFLLLALAAMTLHSTASATSYILPDWEESALNSDFVGVVECVTAGGIVARYRVLESWKGAAVGTELNISQHVDYYGPQFPISLVGQRFFVFAGRIGCYSPRSMLMSDQVPLWWREIPSDLCCFRLTPFKEPFWKHIPGYRGPPGGGYAEFRATVTEFLQCGRDEQERRMMLSVARNTMEAAHPENESTNRELYEALRGAPTVDQLWTRIIEEAVKLTTSGDTRASLPLPTDRRLNTLLRMLYMGGRERCLALLHQLDPKAFPWGEKRKDGVIREIERRLSLDQGRLDAFKRREMLAKVVPSHAELAQAKETVMKPWDHTTDHAFELLCRHAPASAAAFLLQQQASEFPDSWDWYPLASVFGHLCKTDRTAHLKSLMAAQDGWIQTTAEVYLCFDDRAAGEAALRQRLKVDGDQGAWAALVLASRGDKSAMPRALKVMATRPGSTRTTGQHRNLQDRLLVLLSNSASLSGVPQPPQVAEDATMGLPALRALYQQWHEASVAWWKKHESKITLVDPWAALLEEQKVD